MPRSAAQRRKDKALKYDTAVDKEVERTGQHPALPRVRQPKAWKCRVCGYSPLDKKQKYCLSCGRDWYGNPGVDPTTLAKPARPGIRPGVSSPFVFPLVEAFMAIDYPNSVFGSKVGSQNIPNATNSFSDWSAGTEIHDPSGMIGAVPLGYYGGTMPAGKYIRLPVGIWIVAGFAGWDADNTGDRWVGCQVIDDRETVDPYMSHYYGMPLTQNGFAASTVHADSSAHSILFGVSPALVATDSPNSNPGDGLAITQYLWQNSGAQRVSPYTALMATKIADVE